jgi:hypothetical protein
MSFGAFYRHLLSFHETRKFFTDELISTRLLEAQKQSGPNMPNTTMAQARNAGGARSLNGPLWGVLGNGEWGPPNVSRLRLRPDLFFKAGKN